MQIGSGNEDYAGGSSIFDLPKLAPKAAGERARIWIPDPDSISVQYVHGIGGKEAQQPGMPEPQWGGSWICQGNPEVLKASTPHSDPTNCFMCRMHKDGNAMVGKAKRKFIVQVFRYATDPSGGQPLVPFTMSLLVWQFSDKQYRMLSEIQTQWGPVNGRDLLLTSDQQEFAFKQWAVSALPDLMLQRDLSFNTYMQQAWQTQAVPAAELERILGRAASNEQEVLTKIAEITPAAAPGMAQPYAAPPMMAAPAMAPAAAPQLPPTPGYAPPPAAAVYPPNGPFDGAQQQYAPPPAAPAPGMVPPPMPPTPPPAQAVAPPLPQAPPAAAPQVPAPAQAQYAQPAPQVAPPDPAAPQMPAAPQVPQMPQAAPPMAAPPAPPAMPAAPQVPQQAAPPAPQAPPPVAQPGAVPQPGAPAQPGQVDYGALLQAPPPPPPPA